MLSSHLAVSHLDCVLIVLLHVIHREALAANKLPPGLDQVMNDTAFTVKYMKTRAQLFKILY